MREFSLPVCPLFRECQVWGRGVDDSALLFTPNSHCLLRPPVALTLLVLHKLFLFLTFFLHTYKHVVIILSCEGPWWNHKWELRLIPYSDVFFRGQLLVEKWNIRILVGVLTSVDFAQNDLITASIDFNYHQVV